MNYCFQCGHALQVGQPAGDSCSRLFCPSCGYIHYQNPKILVCCIAYWGDQVLWMQRDNEPYRGLWSIPAGFMECNESLAEAAARELYEEAGVRLDPGTLSLYSIGSLTWMSEVYVVFRAPMTSGDCCAGEEACSAALFSEAEAPWDRFAFPEAAVTLRKFYNELQQGRFDLYMGEYTRERQSVWSLLSGEHIQGDSDS